MDLLTAELCVSSHLILGRGHDYKTDGNGDPLTNFPPIRAWRNRERLIMETGHQVIYKDELAIKFEVIDSPTEKAFRLKSDLTWTDLGPYSITPPPGDPLEWQAWAGGYINATETFAPLYEIIRNINSGSLFVRNFGEYMRFDNELDFAWLSSQLTTWSSQSRAWRESATVSDGASYYIPECALMSDTDKRKWMVVKGGFVRPTPQLINAGLEEDDPRRWTEPVKIKVVNEVRQNAPIIRSYAGQPEYIANECYRSGTVAITYEDEITEKPWKDEYGIYDVGGSEWKEDFSYLVYAGLSDLLVYPGGRIREGMLMSADGSTYRIKLRAERRLSGETEWSSLEVVVLTISLGSPASVSFPVSAKPPGASDRVAIEQLEKQTSEGWEAISWPSVGSEPDYNHLLFMAVIRNGAKWGYTAPGNSETHYRTMRHVKMATSKS